MEKVLKPTNGYMALVLSLILLAVGAYLFTLAPVMPIIVAPGILCIAATIFIWKGLMIIQPNHARVLNFFGKYVGSVKVNGMSVSYTHLEIAMKSPYPHLFHPVTNSIAIH